MRLGVQYATLGIATLALVACSSAMPDAAAALPSSGQTPTVTPIALGNAADQYPTYADEESGFGVILGTPDLGVGTNRVAFVLTDPLGIVKFPISRVQTYFLADGPDREAEGPIESVNAQYFDFPLGVRGLYVAELELDREGIWRIDVSILDRAGERVGTSFDFPVNGSSISVALGGAAPPSLNRTLSDVDSVAELTTAGEPDLRLYDLSVNKLVTGGRPFVVTFASPAFCTNALCGPQVEVLSALNDQYADQADFVHIDIYDNPHEIRGDLSRAIRNPLLKEWGVGTDEWTFIVDGAGNVAAKFESFASENELQATLQTILKQ